VDVHTLTKQTEKFKQTLFFPARRLMVTVFWDMNEVLIVEFMQQGTTITPEVYCEPLKNCVVFGMLTYGITVRIRIQLLALLEHFNWELFDHFPYSPDIAASDYHHFTYMKN
jgi:hypothetical protein